MPPQSRSVFDLDEQVLGSDMYNEFTKSKKNVRIELEKNEVFDVPHIDDMSDQEIATIWYDRPDYDAMKQSFIPIIKKMMRGAKVEETESETIRGLEFRTRDGALKRQHNKIQSIHSVLDEQDRQLALGIHDVEKISEIYRETSQHCKCSARDLGEMDEEFIKSNMESTDQSDDKPKKVGGFRKMIRQVRRTSLQWKSSRSLSPADKNPANE